MIRKLPEKNKPAGKHHHFKISPGKSVGTYDVSMDWKPIRGVVKADVTFEANCLPVVRLEVLAGSAEVEALMSRVEASRQYNGTKCSGLGYEACETCDMICPYR